MAFAFTAAVAGAGTVSCAGTTTVTGTGTTFATLTGSAAGANHARVGGTITVGGVTKTIVAIASTTSLTVDTAFGTFTNSAFTVQTGVTQTGTDTMSTSLGVITGFNVTNRGDLLRTFDCRGVDLFINGTLTVDSTVAQLRNDGSCNNSIVITGNVNGGELKINGRKSVANNGPFPYAGFDWLGTNGLKIMRLDSTNATYPAKFTIIDACVRYGADWITTYLNNFSRITTQGEECWILCGKGTGTSQARLRQDNTTASIDFQATQTWVGVWLNFGVPQISLKGYTPIYTDGPEVNLGAVSVATRIPIENYNTTYVTPAYYAGVQFVMLGGGWVRLKNNLVGTNIAWRAASASGRNVLEFSKQIKAISKDSIGNVLNDGYLYFQPVGTNVAGIRPRGVTTDVTFDLSQQNILVSDGFATTEFVYAWDYKNVDGNYNIYSYFCSGTTKGAETHPAYLSRYGYDKQPLTMALSGNNTFEYTASHSSLPTSDKVIATAAAISGIAFNFTTKVMTISGNLTYQQIYDAYQYALNQTANLFQADNCITTNGTSNYVGWTINVGTGVTLTSGGNFTKIQAQTITLTGTALITGIYQDSTGTSTVLQISGFDANSSVYVEDNNAVQKFYSASATGTVTVYIPPTGTGSWYYAVEKYGNQRQSDFFTFSGGILPIVVKAIPDTGLTVLNSATVGAYTALETPDKVYDYVAYLRLSVPHISYGQIVFKDGTALDLQDADMIVNQSATSVASFNYDDKILTVKSSSMVTGVTYNLIKTTPPKTIEAASTEVISVNIEDANGDSSVNIQGGSGNFTLWKITNATPEDQYSTGTNLGNVGNENYRFLSAPGFKIVIRDNTTGFRQVVPMDKGNYTRGLFFGDQVQLAQSQEVTQINTKVDILANDIDAIKGTGFTKDTHSLINIEGYVDAIPTDVWSATTRTLTTSAGGATLAEIEGSTVLAKEAAATANKDAIIAAIGTGGGGSCDLTGIEADLVSIKASTNTIEAATSKMTFDGHYINAVAKVVEDKANYTLTPDEKLNIANAVQAAILNETDGQKILEAIVNAIGNENIDQVALVAAIRADIERTGGVLATRSSEANATTNKAAILTAVGTPLQAANYTAPDNATIAKINDVKAKTDLIPTNTATQTDIATLKTDLEASIGSFPTKEEISTEVWADEPERLKRVATVETTGNQLAAFNH